ncbi:phosphatidylglycerophosphatase and protein-tyrosine phosphatase 1 [Athene cunicularia]|uniref:phosphatidylglycerophosphatase and protein-tyrosine phosphatase 1 n=1 Tax=Athene cunicularia TaxID=194338 RepID=UPI000EF665AA|nr:phosphatidylglycerophosphatase and protein-tyrosine phosphatase 1 [Athene cunicularia]
MPSCTGDCKSSHCAELQLPCLCFSYTRLASTPHTLAHFCKPRTPPRPADTEPRPTENVRAVVALNEEYETRFLCCSAQEWEAMGVEQLRLSTVDLTGVPTLENLRKGVEFILKHRACGNSVYVHCKAGRSRSATLVAAYLIQVHHWSPQEAIEAIAKIRPHILIRHKQVQVLETFHRNMLTRTTA